MAYIDRETALQIIDNYAKTVTEDGKVIADAIRDIIAVITPTADVAEVKYGYWKMEYHETRSTRGRLIRNKTFTCSNCNRRNGRITTKYCSNCGAKMDGKPQKEV